MQRCLFGNELRSLKDKAIEGSWNTLKWMDDEVEAIGKLNAVLSRRSCPKCTKTKMVSTSFGNSKILVDWCPRCKGIWLDRDEFQEIVEFLRDKLNKLSSTEMLKRAYGEIKEIWNGPEDKISEILDAKASIWALINITLFEHPQLTNALIRFSNITPFK